MKIFKGIDILVLLAILQFGSVVIFYFGFVNSEAEIQEFSSKENPFHSEMWFKDEKQKEAYKKSWFPVQSSRVLASLFDGAAYNWVVNKDKLKQQIEKNQLIQGIDMPLSFPLSCLRADKNKTILLEGYSDPPTMTAAKVKAILQGTLPDIIEILLNVKGNRINSDNLVYQEKFNSQEGKAVIYYGSDIWGEYVGHLFNRMNLTLHSGILQRNSEIDNSNYLNIQHEQLFEDDWSSLFSSYQILDVAAHLFKSIEKEMDPYLQNYSYFMLKQLENAKKVKENNKTDSTLIYFSDHGENSANRAMHGGGSELETSIFVFGYDTRGFLPKEKHDIGQLMDKDNLQQLTVNQMDITATYCMLRGIPIPINSIGMIIPDFFIDSEEFDNTIIVHNFFINVKQIYRRVKKIEKLSKLKNIIEIQQTYHHLFNQYKLKGFISDAEVKHFVELCLAYGRIVKSVSAQLILPNQFWVMFSVLSSLITFLSLLLTGQMYRWEAEKITANKNTTFSNVKRFIFGLCLFLFIISFVVKSSTFLIYEGVSLGIVCGFTSAKIFNITKKNLIECRMPSFVKFKQLTDILLVTIGVLFNGVIRMDSKYFSRTQDLLQILFILFYIAWGTSALHQNDKSSLFKIILIAFLIFISTYFSGYQNLTYNALFVIEPLKEILGNNFWRFTFPSVLLFVVYLVIFKKAASVIKCTYSTIKKQIIFQTVFGGFLIFQIYCVVAYFDFVRERKIINELPIRNYFLMNYSAFFLGEIFKLTFLHSMPFTWKITTFLMSLFLTSLISIGFQSVFQYSALIIILSCLGNLSVNLRKVTRRSKYIFLSLLSSWFFYASDHFEKIEAIHIDLLNIGQIWDGIFFSIVNGTNNHFFGQIAISLIVNLFVIVDLHDSKVITSFLNCIFGNSDLNNEKMENQSIKSKVTIVRRQISADEKLSNMDSQIAVFMSSTTDFLLPSFFGIFIAIVRNWLDPQNQDINSIYLPSLLFQLFFFSAFILISVINYLLIFKYTSSPLTLHSLLKVKQIDEIQIFSQSNSQIQIETF